MDIYKIASQKQLRFTTPKGLLSTELLWTLKTSEFPSLIRAQNVLLKKEVQNDDDLSFLDTPTTTVSDKTEQLRFDILKDIYLTKKKVDEDKASAKKIKEDNEKILSVLEVVENNELQKKTPAELRAMLKPVPAE